MTTPTPQTPRKKISVSMKAALIAIPSVLLIFLILVTALNRSDSAVATGESGKGAESVPLVQENSHVLSDGGEGAPVLVEFLDLECEACGAVYPAIEDVRQQYDGELTYVVRYFMTNHSNSMTAALAAEAAAGQGKFEEMYQKLFESQAEWAEKQDSQAELIRSYAEGIGLDMAAYDLAIKDPATQARVEEDHNAGLALGVRGTPSFFLNGTQIQPQTLTELTDAIDEAIVARK